MRRGSLGYQVGLEGRDLTGSCLRVAITPLTDFPGAFPEDFSIDSTMNGSGDLLMVKPPRIGTFSSGMSSFRPRACSSGATLPTQINHT